MMCADRDCTYEKQPAIDGTASMVEDDTADTEPHPYYTAIIGLFTDAATLIDTMLGEIMVACADGDAKLVRGPFKKQARAVEKADLAYGGDLARISDYDRASIVCCDLKTITQIVGRLCTEFDVFPLQRVKNRFDSQYQVRAYFVTIFHHVFSLSQKFLHPRPLTRILTRCHALLGAHASCVRILLQHDQFLFFQADKLSGSHRDVQLLLQMPGYS